MIDIIKENKTHNPEAEMENTRNGGKGMHMCGGRQVNTDTGRPCRRDGISTETKRIRRRYRSKE